MAMSAGDGGGSKMSRSMSTIRSLAKPAAPSPASPVPSAGTPWAPPIKTQVNYAPVQRAAVAPAPAPYSGPVYQGPSGQVMQGTLPSGGGMGGGIGGGIGGGMGGGAPRSYESFSDEEAATDSVFMDQKSQYANALKKFIEDNERQKGIVVQDATTARDGIARNRTNGLTGLSEDFAARGLGNSGLFVGEREKADKQYDKQKTQVGLGEKNAIDDLGFRRAKFEQENGENGSNIQAARREAFARLAASQNLM